MFIIHLVSWIIFGLIIGAIARLFVPGPTPLGCLGTMFVGILGSLLGGFIAWALSGMPEHEYRPAGFLGAILGAIVVVAIYHRFIARPIV